jgi:dTDP-4-dehydrorhamnose reductase
MKILIAGSSGFLGTKLKNILSKNHEIICIDRDGASNDTKTLDVTDFEQVDKLFLNEKPEVIIDTIGLTSSVDCEKNPDLAMKLNYETAKNIAKAAQKIDATVIFLSSAYVFDGKKGDYTEKDVPHPINEYGKTKILAEKEILSLKKGVVFRIDIMYGYNGVPGHNGVFDRILSNKTVEIGDPDQLRQPVFVDDVVGFADYVLNKKIYGLFNVAGPDQVKMIEFIRFLEKTFRKESKIKIVKGEVLVHHPKKATLDISKLGKTGFKTHKLSEGLDLLRKQLIK